MTLSHSLRLHESFFEEEYKRPTAPSHRHAAPSAPWPWIDIEDGTTDISELPVFNRAFPLTGILLYYRSRPCTAFLSSPTDPGAMPPCLVRRVLARLSSIAIPELDAQPSQEKPD